MVLGPGPLWLGLFTLTVHYGVPGWHNLALLLCSPVGKPAGPVSPVCEDIAAFEDIAVFEDISIFEDIAVFGDNAVFEDIAAF